MASFPGIGHLALTITDLGASVPWYTELLGAEPILNEDTGPFHHTVWALENGTMLGLHKHSRPANGDRFDEFRVGLDHVSFHVPTRADLEDWVTRLDELGITHGGIVDAPYGSGLSFRDPDNNALEFFAPPA